MNREDMNTTQTRASRRKHSRQQHDPLGIVFLRAWSQVTAVAWNVSVVSQGDYLLALCSGGLVSWIWWENSRTAARATHWAARAVYTAGAAAGTVTGMWMGRL